ncbi:MAG: cytochrome C biogenesis protein, partial [Planctomycetota bacterium]
WGNIVKERGLMVLAVSGNIITAWSWFGTNLLGVGLHSYGFMDGAMLTLAAFVASQMLIMAAAMIFPTHLWWSFRKPSPYPGTKEKLPATA